MPTRISLKTKQYRFLRKQFPLPPEEEDPNTIPQLLSALSSCTTLRDLQLGYRIQHHSSRLQTTNIYVGNNLINLFSKCGALPDAESLFQSMHTLNPVSWNTLILGYATNGQSSQALNLFQRMTDEGWSPSSRTFIAALMACSTLADEEQPSRTLCGKLVKVSSLKRGKSLHSQASSHGFDRDPYVGTTLVNMYSRCGDMSSARRAFDRIDSPRIASWNALTDGYTENGEPEFALNIFESLPQEPDTGTFLAAVKACTRLARDGDGFKIEALERAYDLHSRALIRVEFDQPSLENALVVLYSECGSMVDARRVFDQMMLHDVVSWTSLLLGYVENDQPEICLRLFPCVDCEPNARTYVAVFKACAARELGESPSFEMGKLYHLEARSKQLDKDVHVASALVDMYSSCRRMAEARTVFDSAVHRDVVLWNSVMLGYAENNQGELALELFRSMDCEPNSQSFVAALVAIGRLTDGEERRLVNGQAIKPECLIKTVEIHSQVATAGLDTELYVASSLVNVYSKCGSMEEASKVFERMGNRTTVAWNSLVIGYVGNGDPVRALWSFRRMHLEGCRPDARSFVAGLMACSSSPEIRAGTEIQLQAGEAGLDRETYVANTLIDMHSKLGNVSAAEHVFHRMLTPTTVSWNALILGYAENNRPELALESFSKMSALLGESGLETQTFLAVFRASSSLSSLETGTGFHALACKLGLENSPSVANSLVDFYGKCGDHQAAETIFNSMTSRTSVSWTSLISVYSNIGDATRTISLLGAMLEDGIRPDGITLSLILSACSRAGRVEDGKKLFTEMVTRFRIQPESEHFHCMIDMLGRSNKLEEALAMAESMPFKATAVTWTMILGAAHKWRNLRVGEMAFQELVRVDPEMTAGYELMGNIYGSLGMWEKKEDLNRKFSRRRVLKRESLARFL